MSNKANYLDMFKSPIFSPEVVAQNIHDARTEFKRHDMIVWFLKYCKYYTIKNALEFGGNNGDDYPAEKKWLSNFERSHPTWKDSDPKGEEVKLFLRHIIDLDIPQINDFRFANESFDEIKEIMENLEGEWREQLAYEAVEGYGHKVVSFPDGSAWFDLERAGCSIESEAMGHCGNGNGRPGQTLLSYRRPVGDIRDNMWSPRLTFVLDKNRGALGEMKGRANEKPAEKYHPYIIELLKTDRIKKLVGGGYKPECNFSLQDLSVKDREYLLKTKPSLFSVTELAKIYRGDLSKCPVDLVAAITEEIGSEAIDIEGVKWRKLVTNMDYEDIVKSFKLTELKNYTEVLIDDYMHIDHVFRVDHHAYAEDVISDFKSKHPEMFDRWIEELKNYLDDEDIECLNLDSGKGVVEALLLENDDYKNAVERALGIGDECGAMDELYIAFDAYLKSPLRDTNGAMLKRIEEGDYDKFDLMISDDYILETVSSYRVDEYQCEDLKSTILNWIDEEEKKEDLEVPRYGFSGFDEDAALDSLYDGISELLPDITKAETVDIKGVTPFGESDNPEAMKRFAKQAEPTGMGF